MINISFINCIPWCIIS